jgi:hypothetical protein
VLTRVIRLAPKTRAAARDARVNAVAASELRTGTALRPRPGSNAIRTPMPPVTDPATANACASREPRSRRPGAAMPTGSCVRPATRQANGDSNTSGRRAMTASPVARMARLTSTPGLGSASRAGPMGISGDAAIAMATAKPAPEPVTAPALARNSAASLALVIPRAPRMGNSAESRMGWRPMSWPSTTSARIAASAANTARLIDSGRIACSVAPVCPARFVKLSGPADG